MKKTSTLNRLLSLVLCICLVLSLVPGIPLAASAASGGLAYIDETGVGQTYTGEYTLITADTSTLSSGWYTIEGDLATSNRLSVSGTVHLVLPDGVTLNAKSGIRCASGNTLILYAQSTAAATMGKLIATGGQNNAGIGGNHKESGGTVTVNGGIVTATGGNYAAGIGGGGTDAYSYNGGTVTVNGGIVTATGGNYAAGIGGGDRGGDGGTVTINGGNVTAIGGKNAAGIGGGDNGFQDPGNGGTVTVNGGIVTATGDIGAAGIGGGRGGSNYAYVGNGGTFTINNGIVIATATISHYVVPGEAIGHGGGGTADSGTKNYHGGIVFEGSNTGVMYGTGCLLDQDFKLNGEKTITVNAGQTFTVDIGVTLINHGKLVNNGSVVNRGILEDANRQLSGTTYTNEGNGKIYFEHPYDLAAATCTQRGTCTICGDTNGPLEPSKHTGELNLYIRNDDQTHSLTWSCCKVKVGATYHTYENGVCTLCGDDCNVHTWQNGFCTRGCTAYEAPALNSSTYDVNGDGVTDAVYEIANGGQLYWFAGLVNGTLKDVAQNRNACAVLVQDIYVNTDVLTDGALNTEKVFRGWTPIGSTGENAYGGTFDGMGHRVSGLYANCPDTQGVGLFGFLGASACVRSLGVEDSWFSGKSSVGSIVGKACDAQLLDCYAIANVSASGDYAGGIAGELAGESSYCLAQSCWFRGAVRSTADSKLCGGICGGFSGGYASKVQQCYYLDEKDSIPYSNYYGEGKEDIYFTSGDITFQLNGESHQGTWKQTLGQDLYPRFEGDPVYCGYLCATEEYVGLTNEIAFQEKPHYDENGYCALCRTYQPGTLAQDGYYEIRNVGQLQWFAMQVNSNEDVNKSFYARLVSDITVNEDLLDQYGELNTEIQPETWIMLGDGSHAFFNGVFDGNYHTISGLYVNNEDAQYAAFIGMLRNGCVKNLGITDSYFSSGHAAAAFAGCGNGTIENCFVTNTVIKGKMADSFMVTHMGSFSEYDYENRIRQCWSVAEVYADGVKTEAATPCETHYQNTYYLADADNGLGGKTAGQFAGGEVAYLLGAPWGQDLNADEFPVWNGKTIYAGFNCGGTDTTYSNEPLLNQGDSYHIPGYWMAQYNGTHGREICTRPSCAQYGEMEYQDCYGGSATCCFQKVCDLCGAYYGDVDPAVHENEKTYLIDNGDGTHSRYHECCDGLDVTEVHVCGEWDFDSVDHWKSCICGYSELAELGPHSFDSDGFCTVCGGYEPAKVVEQDYTYVAQIEKAGHLFWYARNWRNCPVYDEEYGESYTVSAGAVLMNDIDLNPGFTFFADGTYAAEDSSAEPRQWNPIREYGWVDFDGGNHTISGLYIDNPNEDNAAMFASNDYYTVKNIKLVNGFIRGGHQAASVVASNTGNVANCHSSLTVMGKVVAGGIVAYDHSTISNCSNTGNVQVYGEATSGAGGIVGLGSSAVNCINTGNVSGGIRVGGIMGSGSSVSNCINMGAVVSTAKDADPIANNADIENSYYLANEELEDGGKTAQQFASGQIAYLLQSNVPEEDIYDEDWNYIGSEQPHVWGQTIGEDAYPVLGGEAVYQLLDCGEGTVSYSNEYQPAHHVFDALTGECNCGLQTQASASVTIGETTTDFRLLGDAIQAVKDCTLEDQATVKLLVNLDLGKNGQNISSGEFTLDLNGCELIGSDVVVSVDGANVTITDSGAEGKIIDGFIGVSVNEGGIVTIAGGTILAEDRGVVGDQSTIIITGGTIIGGELDIYSVISELILTVEEGKTEGATFPGGITIDGVTLDYVLADGVVYWQNGQAVLPGIDAKEITGDDVVIKVGCYHNWADATCTAPKTCSVCGTTEGEALGHGHTEGIRYEEVDDGTHLVFCDDCYSTIEWGVECTYSDDTHTCICGNLETFTIRWLYMGSYTTETYKYGETVNDFEVAPIVSETGKHTFLYWCDLADESRVTLPMTMPAKNLEFCAAYSYTGWNGEIGSGRYSYWIDSVEVRGWFNVNENNEPVGEGEGTRYYAGEDYNVVNDITLIDGVYYAFDHATGAFLSDYTGFYDALNGEQYYVTNGVAVTHNGHTEETVPGYAATCTEPGLTDGVKCSVCGEILTAQKEILANGHNFVNGGCTNCDAEIQVSLPGSFNGWDTNAWIMTRNEDGTYTYQIHLDAGSYTFKIMNDGNWLGNNGTISDDTDGYEWIFGDAGDCTLSASGGTYTFIYNINTNGLKVEAVLDQVHDYTITFTDEPGYEMVQWSYTITKPYGAPITAEDLAALEAAIPTVENYYIDRWYLPDYQSAEIPATMPNYDQTFYASWRGVESFVTFYSDASMSEESFLFVSCFRYGEHYDTLESFIIVNRLDEETPADHHIAAIKYADGTEMQFPYTHGTEGFSLYVVFERNACEVHTEETVPGYAADCVNPGLTDGVICTVCGETITAQKEIPAPGHSYEDDVCTVCGHIGVPVKLDSASLSFKEKIHYNIFFSLGLDETVDLSDMGLIMFDSLNADGTMDDAIATYSGAVEIDGKYMVATDGVHAKRMGDTIYFRAYAKLADGSYVYSKTVQYSAVTYAEHILNSDEPESAKALVVAMLNYGAAAQMFFGYNTDNLVNAFLTDEQKALPEQYRDDMANTVPVVAAEKQGIFTNNKGFSKRAPAVSFEGAFEINYFFTPAYAPVDGITLYYWTEADFEANEVLTVDNATGSLKLEGTGTEQYRGDIGGIAAKNLSENIYVAAVYSDGTTTWTSGVLGYSIGAYCSSMAKGTDAMAELAKATAVYGYHAKAYFG